MGPKDEHCIKMEIDKSDDGRRWWDAGSIGGGGSVSVQRGVVEGPSVGAGMSCRRQRG